MGPFKDGWCKEDVEAVLRRGDPANLLYAPIVVSMDPPDCRWAQDVCVRLAQHPDPTVRGNAILGFGHLARTCRRLDESIVRPLVEAALSDKERYVFGHATDAVADLVHYLGWTFKSTSATVTEGTGHADRLLPSRGGTCAKCGRFVAALPGATLKHDERTVELIQSGQTVSAIKLLREETGCSLALAKEMVEHMYGRIRRPLGPPCASCGSPLRTPRAKLCAECGARVDQ